MWELTLNPDICTKTFASVVRQAFSILKRIVHELYSESLSRNLSKRAQYEYQIVRSIQNLLQEYMLKTQAYEEITDGRCPLIQTSPK